MYNFFEVNIKCVVLKNKKSRNEVVDNRQLEFDLSHIPAMNLERFDGTVRLLYS